MPNASAKHDLLKALLVAEIMSDGGPGFFEATPDSPDGPYGLREGGLRGMKPDAFNRMPVLNPMERKRTKQVDRIEINPDDDEQSESLRWDIQRRSY